MAYSIAAADRQKKPSFFSLLSFALVSEAAVLGVGTLHTHSKATKRG